MLLTILKLDKGNLKSEGLEDENKSKVVDLVSSMSSHSAVRFFDLIRETNFG